MAKGALKLLACLALALPCFSRAADVNWPADVLKMFGDGAELQVPVCVSPKGLNSNGTFETVCYENLLRPREAPAGHTGHAALWWSRVVLPTYVEDRRTGIVLRAGRLERISFTTHASDSEKLLRELVATFGQPTLSQPYSLPIASWQPVPMTHTWLAGGVIVYFLERNPGERTGNLLLRRDFSEPRS